MIYKIRLVHLDGEGNIVQPAMRTSTYISPVKLNVGGLYFLRKNQLYRIEREL